jgi:YidC/Oxa1 family membrane protein insertase
MWNTIILQPMINTLLMIYKVLGTGPHTFGLAIILFTVLVRLITLPLTYQQMRSSMLMQELQQSKKWKKMQEKYKGDKQKLSEEQMKLYQEAGQNPLSGCLPTLIQFPIIIGLYQAIIRTMAATPTQLFDLSKLIYSAIPSSLIPLNSTFLWMNLGQPERLPLTFLANVPILSFLSSGIPVLAILVVISTWLQTKLTTPPTTDSQGAAMTQMMSIYMPLLLGYFAFTFASGLALYFVASNVLGILQGVIMRRTRQSAQQQPSAKGA